MYVDSRYKVVVPALVVLFVILLFILRTAIVQRIYADVASATKEKKPGVLPDQKKIAYVSCGGFLN